jgi:hypothetical protein
MSMSFGIHKVYRHIFRLWRERRFEVFLRRLNPRKDELLLDVGGDPGFWVPHVQPVKRIDTLNLIDVTWNKEAFPNHAIRTLVGDGCALQMADKSYDIGFSNSVIEHVGPWERQEAFAREIRRVARKIWVQTPAYECPIEPHYLAPLVHYLPRWLQERVLRWCRLGGWLVRPSHEAIHAAVESTRLLRKSEMNQLFPDCEILIERLLWVLPKAYVAIRL